MNLIYTNVMIKRMQIDVQMYYDLRIKLNIDI